MSRERPTPSNRQILEEAAEWFVEINECRPDRETRERFDAWLRASPEHVRAYLRILPVWEEGAALSLHADVSPPELIAWAKNGDNVVALDAMQSGSVGVAREPEAQPRRTGTGSWRVAALAASVLLLVAAATFMAWRFLDSRSIYDTDVGDQRLIALSDGSRVELNSRSRIRVRFTDGERSVDLLAGQALFKVAKDSRRPFIVRSGDAAVHAIGTQFDVYRKREATVVTVVEGRVAVLPVPAELPRLHEAGHGKDEPVPVVLSAGEQSTVVGSTASGPKRTNVALATAWTQQRLEFSRTPLSDVAEEFNRYNQRQLVVKDGDLRGFNVSGSFSSSDPGSLVRFLRAQPGIRVTETETEISVSQD